ncbi:major facilitator superfamily domain-containing protein [Aspergillus aurantiobrunneus]
MSSESTPFLKDPLEPVLPTPCHSIDPKQRRRIIRLLCVFTFIALLGNSLQPAALMQVLEDAICSELYSIHPTSGDERCKAPPVQKELAIIRGIHQLVPVFSATACTIPYGLLADRRHIGRRRALILSGIGTAAALAWVLAVSCWRFVSVRWAWLSGVFLFIGGGDSVASSLVHVLVTDVVEQSETARIFMYFHAADVIASLLGPGISAILMGRGHTWHVLLLALGALLARIALAGIIPETLHLRDENTQALTESTSLDNQPILTDLSSTLSPLLSLNRQALLLLCIYFPQAAARDLFTTIGLQYSNARFSLPYSSGSALLSFFQGAQAFFVLVLLPLLTWSVARFRCWPSPVRDRYFTIASIALTTVGTATLGLAPSVRVEGLGLLLVACGRCATGFVMSLLSGVITAEQVSAVYSVAVMGGIVEEYFRFAATISIYVTKIPSSLMNGSDLAMVPAFAENIELEYSRLGQESELVKGA